MAGNKDILNIGKETRFGAPNGNDNTKGGKRPSIRNQLIALMEQEGRLKIPKSQILSIEKDGSIVIKLPKQEQIAMKLVQWSLTNKGLDSLKAIQMITEHIDGKPKQEIEQTNVTVEPDYSRLTNDELEIYSELQAKLFR